jgi:hypothetical protein
MNDNFGYVYDKLGVNDVPIAKAIISGVIGIALIIPTFFIMSIVFFIVRTFPVFIAFLRSPLLTLGEIPKNWRRMVLCTDLARPPEVLPDMEFEEDTKGLEHFRFKRIILDEEVISFRNKLLSIVLIIFAVIPSITFWYLPAMAYRWSLKSTALIWSPLFWIVSPATDDLATRLREICKAALYRVMRLYSLVVAVLFLAKLYVLWSWHELMTNWSQWPELAEMWARIPQSDVLNAYIVPPEIPPWQLAAAINAVLAWIAFFIADLLLVRSEKHQSLPGDWLNDAFRWVAIVRNTLSLYAIACTLYITVELALEGRWDLPPLGAKLFPWS